MAHRGLGIIHFYYYGNRAAAAREWLIADGAPLPPLFIGVSYQTPPDTVVAVLRRLLAQMPELPPEPEPTVRVVAYKAFAIEYEIRYFLRGYADYRRVEGEIYRLIWYHFRRHGIEIPFPIRNVYLRTAEGTVQREDPSLRLERTLRGIDLFQPLSEDELHLVASRFRRHHYAARERPFGLTAEQMKVLAEQGKSQAS